MSNNQALWQKLGAGLSTTSSSEALQKAGLDWKVEKKPIYLTNDGNQELNEIPNSQAVVRIDNNSVLGIVGERYEIVQNHEAFTWCDEIFHEQEIVFERAGLIHGGSTIWMLAKMKESIEVTVNDYVNQYLLLTTSHDGSSSISVYLTPIRVVCANTLALAKNSAGENHFRIKHTKNVTIAMTEFVRIMQYAKAEFDESMIAYQSLAKKEISSKDVMVLNKKLFPPPQGNDDYSSLTKNKMKNIYRLYNGAGIGSDLAGGTLWGWYNAITELVDHSQSSRNDEQKLKSMWWGAGYFLKMKALTIALQYS